MKNKFLFSTILFLIAWELSAQINLTNNPNIDITGSSVFLDASTGFSAEAGQNNNIGKGIVVPSVDLVNFEFDLTLADGITFPTYFDGMLVYNNATGTTLTTGNRSATAKAVTPGFYYFSNPNGATNGNVTGGVWTPLGGGNGLAVTSSESTSGLSVNGTQVYCITGTFQASGSSTAVSVTVPAGMTGYYSFVTFANGKTFRNTIYSFDITSSTNNVICGNSLFSEVLPAGTYSYVLEYFK